MVSISFIIEFICDLSQEWNVRIEHSDSKSFIQIKLGEQKTAKIFIYLVWGIM